MKHKKHFQIEFIAIFQESLFKVAASFETNYGNQFWKKSKVRKSFWRVLVQEKFSPWAFFENLGIKEPVGNDYKGMKFFLCIFTAFEKVLALLISELSALDIWKCFVVGQFQASGG